MGILIYQVIQGFHMTYQSFIDKTDPKDRTKQEDYWIQTLSLKAKLYWDLTLKMV